MIYNICALCGKPIFNKQTTDHIIPVAIFKWIQAANNSITQEELDELSAIIGHPMNKCKVHEHCNVVKSCSFEKPAYLSKEQSEVVDDLLTQAAPYIKSYTAFLDEMAALQRYGCYRCHLPVSDAYAVVRRLNNKAPRSKDNAMLLCSGCNVYISLHRRSNWRDDRHYRRICDGRNCIEE